MKTTDQTYQINLLVARDDLKGAIQQMITKASSMDTDSFIQVILLARDLTALEKASLAGILSWEQVQMEKKKIAYRLLSMVNSNQIA